MSEDRWQSVGLQPAPITRTPLPMPQFAHRAPCVDPCALPTPLAAVEKRIRSNQPADLDFFVDSEALARLMTFLLALNAAATNRTISQVQSSAVGAEETAVSRVVAVLDQLDAWLDEYPPIGEDAFQRFGNRAFRSWHAHLEQHALPLLQRNLKLPPATLPVVWEEIRVHFVHAFGDPTRIDYGTGHELNFVAFLCCLHLLGCFRIPEGELEPAEGNDAERERKECKVYAALVFVVFHRYLLLVRRIQTMYKLEPAGSRGVWGLDDYQFLPYLFGSAQFLDSKHLRPKSILNMEVVQTYAHDYLFLEAVAFVCQMKSGPFHEHSPMLYDISAVPSWRKVNQGLIKMYVAEVLKKAPVVQHFYFGNLLPWKPVELAS